MLTTNSEYLRPEIMDVLRAFNCEQEDFTHYFSHGGDKFFNCIEYSGNFFDFETEQKVEDETEFKRYAKRYAKLAFYKVLSGKYGSLPWGALTGIRPTKLAYAELAVGRNFEELFKTMGVCGENTALVQQVLSAQKSVYAPNSGQDVFISIPFCPTKCEYCSFITAPIDKTRGFVDEYINCLVREIASIKDIAYNPRSIYIGGGTPFVLETAQLERVFAAVKSAFPKGCEFTVEAGRPDVFSEDKLKLSKDYGVTRICVNPQSFNDNTLQSIGRKHTAAQTLEAYGMAKESGFDINLDLIAGLADESVADFEKSVQTAISINPANITVHTLSLKAGAKLKERVQRLNVDGIAEMIKLSRQKLSEAGYEPYYLYRQKYQAGGLENVGWSKPGKACVYNVDVMEEICDNIAVGANAISKKLFESGARIERYAAPKDIPTYINKTDKIIEERLKLFKGE